MPSTRTRTPPTMRCMDASSSCAGAMTRDRSRHFAITIITKGRCKKRCVSLDRGAPHGDGTGTIDNAVGAIRLRFDLESMVDRTNTTYILATHVVQRSECQYAFAPEAVANRSDAKRGDIRGLWAVGGWSREVLRRVLETAASTVASTFAQSAVVTLTRSAP